MEFLTSLDAEQSAILEEMANKFREIRGESDEDWNDEISEANDLCTFQADSLDTVYDCL